MCKVPFTLLASLLWLIIKNSHGFCPIAFPRTSLQNSFTDKPDGINRRCFHLQMATLPDIESMRAAELRKELQSYGISTKSFLEKTELVDAVIKARKDGKTPVAEPSKSSDDEKSSTGATREEKIASELKNCSSMKVGELKKELESLGISTKSFFEKSEFVRALAEARVDGVKAKGSSKRKSKSREEKYDPSYRDVIMQKLNLDPRDPRWGGATIIDIKLKE